MGRSYYNFNWNFYSGICVSITVNFLASDGFMFTPTRQKVITLMTSALTSAGLLNQQIIHYILGSDYEGNIKWDYSAGTCWGKILSPSKLNNYMHIKNKLRIWSSNLRLMGRFTWWSALTRVKHIIIFDMKYWIWANKSYFVYKI